MLTYQSKKNTFSPSHSEKPWLLLLLVFAWLWPGVFSHDLWNPTEPKIYGAIEYMQQYGQWALPQILGRWQLDTSPLYIWLGMAFKSAFSPWLMDSFSAVRMVSVGFMAIGLWAVGVAGRNILGRYQGRSVVLILVGSIGLVMPAHRMDSIPLVFAALSLLLCGLSFLRIQRAFALFILASAYVLAFYSGFLLLLSICLAITFAMLLQNPWRSKDSTITVLLAMILALPLCLLWPYALYKTNISAFETWWHYYSFADYGGIANGSMRFSLPYYAENVLWYAFPAWPLAIWTWVNKKQVDKEIFQLTVTWLLIATLVLATLPKEYTENTILLLIPLALLGAAQLDSLRRGAAAFLNWFGIMTFGLLACFIWVGFWAMNQGWPSKLAERAAYFSPYYKPDWDWFPILVAVSFTPLWLWAVTRKNIKGRQAVTNWAAGVTLVWSLLMTIYLHWLDDAKSYRPVVLQMEQSLPESLKIDIAKKQVCIGVEKDNMSIILPWQTYGSVGLNWDENAYCQYRMIVGKDNVLAIQSSKAWHIVWQGARPREKHEWFALVKTTVQNETE